MKLYIRSSWTVSDFTPGYIVKDNDLGDIALIKSAEPHKNGTILVKTDKGTAVYERNDNIEIIPPGWYDKLHELMDTYNITEAEAELYIEVKQNLNTVKGERAYIELMESILERNGDDPVLYDLGADFSPNYEFQLIDEMDRIWKK